MYKDAKRPIQMQATEPEQFLSVVSRPQARSLPRSKPGRRNRQGMIIGPMLANQYGWKVGDRIPIRSQIWRKLDGSDTWQFDIVAIYDVERRRREQGQRVLPLRRTSTSRCSSARTQRA